MDRSLRARVVLAELSAMGLTVDDLVAEAVHVGLAPTLRGPTFAEYLPLVAAGYGDRSRRTFNSYWRLAVDMIGDRPIRAVTTDDCHLVVERAGELARTRRADSDGRASKESCITALRAVFTRAQRAGLIDRNPALEVPKPRRLPNRRRGLTGDEVAELWAAVAATTSDPDHDLLLVRFHLETAARRIGAINLRIGDVDRRRSTVWLREKGGAEREQPISPSLHGALVHIAHVRGSTKDDEPVFRTATRDRATGLPMPLTDRRYDIIFGKAQRHLPWSARVPVTAHVLRHTAITAIERIAGFAVAQQFAGHRDGPVTLTYTKADISEVAAAVAILTGEPHPLATGSRR